MVMFVKITFEDRNDKEKLYYQEISKELKKLEEKINRVDFNVYCVDRDDEGFYMGDYDLEDGVYGEIFVEGDNIYEKIVKDRIEGSKNFVNWMN